MLRWKQEFQKEGAVMKGIEAELWFVFTILLVLWTLGYILNVADGYIHLLLPAAVVILFINLFNRRKSLIEGARRVPSENCEKKPLNKTYAP
jgi:hypothetical protein